MAAEDEKSGFEIVDLYDARLKEYEAYCKEYEENDGYYYESEEEREARETPEECRERLLGGLCRGEEFILVKYNGREESVTVPNGVTGLNSYVFSNMNFLRSVYIPDSVRNIGRNAFSGSTALQDVRLSENLREISREAFYGCTALKTLIVPDSVEMIAIHAFDGCTALESIRLGKSLIYIGWDAFARCTALKSVWLPERIMEIDLNAFYDSGLEEIYIPKNVKSLNSSAFLRCDKLRKIEVDPDNPYYYSRDNCVYLTKNKWLTVGRNDGTLPDDGSFTDIMSDAFANNPLVTELKIPDGVKYIDASAFNGCVNLRRVSFPDTLKKIGRCAFEGCTSLEEIVIPGGVEVIEGLSFFRSGVKKVVIKRGVKVIDDHAFYKCPNLRELYIPSSVKKIWAPIGYSSDADAAPVRVFIETSEEKNYESWIKQFDGFDVVLGFESDIFD